MFQNDILTGVIPLQSVAFMWDKLTSDKFLFLINFYFLYMLTLTAPDSQACFIWVPDTEIEMYENK